MRPFRQASGAVRAVAAPVSPALTATMFLLLRALNGNCK